MWRLWHKLFGWNYVAYIYGHEQTAFRVYTSKGGNYITTHGDIKFLKDTNVKPLTTETVEELY